MEPVGMKSSRNRFAEFREKLRKHGYRVLMISDLQRGIERAGDEFSPVEVLVIDHVEEKPTDN